MACFWCRRLEGRAQQLVEAGEAVMAICETRLRNCAGIDTEIVQNVRQARRGANSHACVIAVAQWSIFALSVAGVPYAIVFRYGKCSVSVTTDWVSDVQNAPIGRLSAFSPNGLKFKK